MNGLQKNVCKVMLALSMVFSIVPTNVFAEDLNGVNQSGIVHKASDWAGVQWLIDSASANDTIDITALRSTEANVSLTVSKDIIIKCEASDEGFSKIKIKDLFFTVNNNATLTLENVVIENNKLEKSVISGTGNTVISKSVLEPNTANGTPTSYNPPATIDVVGDVTVMTDAGFGSSVVAGASIIERNSGKTGTAGIAIKANNVTINGGFVLGGSSFESDCDSGDAIVASGNVTINGVRQSDGESNALVQGGSMGETALNTTAGLPIRFTESSEKQRVLFVHGGNVFGTDKSDSGSPAPYTVVMSEKDIAIIDNGKIGWYTNVPVFSKGFFYITNPVATWGTLDTAIEVFPLRAINATLSETKTVSNGTIVNNYAPQNAQITITADAPTTGNEFYKWTTIPSDIIFENGLSATTTFKMPAKEVEVTANYGVKHIHSASTSWSKDTINHWHDCVAKDGKKMDVESHTYGKWVMDSIASESEAGSKYRDCICGQRETMILPKLPYKNIIDTVTGLTLEYEDGKTFDSDISLVVTPKTKEEMKKFQDGVDKVAKGMSIGGLYDIKLLKDGVEIQPNRKLKITLSLTDVMNDMSDLQVVYIDDGKVTIIPSQLIDGKLVFVTDHFSFYGVIGKEKSIDPIQPEESSKPNSPQTGDTSKTVRYLGLIIASGCLAGYGFKKKKFMK